MSVICLVLTLVLALFDILQDVAEAMNFKYGVPLIDNCSKKECASLALLCVQSASDAAQI